MQTLPEKLTTQQRKFIAEVKAIGLTPDGEDADVFWEMWQERGLDSGRDFAKTRVPDHSLSTAVREAEFVSEFINSRLTPYEVQCKACERKFFTNYKSNKHCSTDCLAQTLQSLGLKWDPFKPEAERWGGEPPANITPESIRVLVPFAQAILQISNRISEVHVREPVDREQFKSTSPDIPTVSDVTYEPNKYIVLPTIFLDEPMAWEF